jgi:hypothetical protein
MAFSTVEIAIDAAAAAAAADDDDDDDDDDDAVLNALLHGWR